MNTYLPKRKTLFWGGAIASLLCIITLPKANAFLVSELDGWLWTIIRDVATKELNPESWLRSIENILRDPCGGYPVLTFLPTETPWCTGTGGNSGIDSLPEIVRDSQGPLGIPNPNETRGKIGDAARRSDANTSVDVFEINNVVWGVYAANQLDRDLTRIAVEGVIGQSGQEAMQASVDETQKVVEQIGKDADEAQQLDITQDVMKIQAKNFAQQTAILGALRADNLKARVDTQFTNLNLGNISRTLDELSRTERASLAGNAMLLLDAVGQANLR